MRDNYYRTGEGFVCVYSITTEESFNSVREFHKAILRVTEREHVPFVLVGNKADLESQRVVSEGDGRKLAEELRCGFLETSAKNNVNVEQSFLELVKLVLADKRELAADDGKNKKCVIC
jgi:GTPase SAR1 family protein